MKKYCMRFFDDNFHSKLPVVLKTMLVCLCAAVVVSQTGLIFDSTRGLFTAVDTLDGAVSASGSSINQKGRVVLTLTDGVPNEKIAVLVNGDEYSKFDAKNVEIEIVNQSVIEIVNDNKQNITVRVDSISDNLYATFNNREIAIDNIGVLCRVIFQ
ncbi:MAG: hypothetical protein IJ365_03850 [Clostridia bacterium]|nr:hypothetical protein [Clostridia bacterium]